MGLNFHLSFLPSVHPSSLPSASLTVYLSAYPHLTVSVSFSLSIQCKRQVLVMLMIPRKSVQIKERLNQQVPIRKPANGLPLKFDWFLSSVLKSLFCLLKPNISWLLLLLLRFVFFSIFLETCWFYVFFFASLFLWLEPCFFLDFLSSLHKLVRIRCVLLNSILRTSSNNRTKFTT